MRITHLLKISLTLLISFGFLSILFALVGAAAPADTPSETSVQTILDLSLPVDNFLLNKLSAEGDESQWSLRLESILGGERDVSFQVGGIRVEWDGMDGDPTSLDHTGLGGLDLTAGGMLDHFVIDATDAMPTRFRLQVFTDEINWSSFEVQIPAANQESSAILIPYKNFTVQNGRGADFTNVGALVAEIKGEKPESSIHRILLDSHLAVTKVESLARDANGDNQTNAGDQLSFEVMIKNTGLEPLDEFQYRETFLGRRYGLSPGSITTSKGQVVSGNRPGDMLLSVEVDSLLPQEETAITYQVDVELSVISATLILQNGDLPPGGGGNAVDLLNSPFTNGNGQVGFVGAVAGDRFVWLANGIRFLSSSVVSPTLTGGEGTMGVSNSGGFIFSPAVNGEDAVWTHNGLLAVENVQAPGFPPGTISTFHSRPTMSPDGEAHWVAGFNESGGTTTEGRMLYTSPGALPSSITVTLRADDVISGLMIDRPSGIGFDYQFADNNNHLIIELLMDTGSTADDGFIYVDGSLIARETAPSGDGDNWDNFDIVSINDNGDYLFTGDTDGSATSDEFIAFNGAIGLREGDTINGIPLTSSALLRAASLNNLRQVAHAWTVSGGTEILFAACDAIVLTNSIALIATGDQVDLDGNGTGDATITDFNADSNVGPGLWLAEDGQVFLEVDLDYGGGDLEAIISLEFPCEEPLSSIEIAPSSLASTQFPDEVLTQTLTISNVGNADLVWGIVETTSAFNREVVLSLAKPSAITPDNGLANPVFMGANDVSGQGLESHAPAIPEGSVTLILDDGSRENSLGLAAGGQFVWFNRFTPAPSDFPFLLEEVHILFSPTGVNVGELVDIYVYEDTDGDGDPGTGANHLGTLNNAAVQFTDNINFSIYNFATPVMLNGPGDVLIAVVNRTAGADQFEYPATIDQTASQVRSWLGIYSTGNPADPPEFPADSAWGIVESFAFPGNWMIRGLGQTGCLPEDIPWVSTSPFNGITAPGNRADVTVSFDSTGLAVGVYTGIMCVQSNDPTQPTLQVPITMTVEPIPPMPSIALTKTVGTTPGICATTNAITVTGVTNVFYCYEVANTGNITLTLHDLVDSQFGPILDDFAFPLGPGDKVDTVAAGLTFSATITATTVNTGTWTAFNLGPVNVASAMDTATVSFDQFMVYLPTILKEQGP